MWPEKGLFSFRVEKNKEKKSRVVNKFFIDENVSLTLLL